MESLAIKYRPKDWSDVTEQATIVDILKGQIGSGELQHAYLFCGSAGTGKTTCARIFANEINQGKGNPIELDAASNNGVDDMRNIIQQAKMKSLDSEYKVIILDEVHSISTNGWQALLKTLEEPPAKSIFIMCTTNPEKIPGTVLSRVQRYQFQRISQNGIVDRLKNILYWEGICPTTQMLNNAESALAYIAKLADGGMRDAITMLDKCLAYSEELTIENIISTLGVVDYDLMFRMTKLLCIKDDSNLSVLFGLINQMYESGKDLKVFVNTYLEFVLDVCKYICTHSFGLIKIPDLYKTDLDELETYCNPVMDLLDVLMQLKADIKLESNPRMLMEATFFKFVNEV